MTRIKLVLLGFLALAPLGCGGGDSPVEPSDPPHVTPAVVDTVDSISVAVGTLGTEMPTIARASWGTDSSQSLISASGVATLTIPQNYRGIVRVTIAETAVNQPSGRALTYSLYHQRILGFTIRSKKFLGMDVSAADMISSPTDNDHSAFARLWGTNISGTSERRWELLMRPDGDYPLATTIDRDSSVAFSASDSIMIWKGLNEVNRILGKTYFIPSTSANAKVKIILKNVLSGSPGGEGGPTLPDFAAHKLDKSVIRFNYLDRMRSNPDSTNNKLIEHDAMHALGVGHTCIWNSLMVSAYSDSCVSRQASSITSTDVIIFRFLEAFSNKQREMGADFGIAESYNAEQLIKPGGKEFQPTPSDTHIVFFALPFVSN